MTHLEGPAHAIGQTVALTRIAAVAALVLVITSRLPAGDDARTSARSRDS